MIYFVEDDDTIRNFVVYALNNSGFEAEGFGHPDAFWEAMKGGIPDVILLDRMLPKEDGMSILKKLRERHDTMNIPIMMVTAMGTEYDKVMGLDGGADDYLVKPFGTMELISRVRALLRRSRMQDKKKEYSIGSLYVCPGKHIVRVGGEDVALTFKEFELLCMLVEHDGTVFTRDQILKSIWGYDFDGESRTVDVHIRTLRMKLGPCGELIETVRGIGYKIGGIS